MKAFIHIISGTLLVVMFLLPSCDKYELSDGQALRFVKYFPDASSESNGIDLIRLQNGGYVVLANALLPGVSGSQYDIMVVFTDAYGNKTEGSPYYYGSAGDDFGHSIVQTSGGFIIAGSSQTGNEIASYILKIDGSGQLLWEKNYASFEEQVFKKIIESGIGEYALTGYCKDVATEKQVYMMKIDAAGDSIWTRRMGTAGFNELGMSLAVYQNRYVIVGSTKSASDPNGIVELLIYNTSVDGNNIFKNRIGSDYDLLGKDILVNSNGDIVILGNQFIPFSGKNNLSLSYISLREPGYDSIIIDQSEIIDHPQSLYGEKMIAGNQGGVNICGWRTIQTDVDILFAAVDQNLKLITINFQGTSGYQSSASIIQTSDEVVVWRGTVELSVNRTCMIMKTGANGEF